MLRIAFTSEDLARVRVAARPDPLWEVILSLHQLAAPAPDAGPFAGWSEWVRTAARDRVLPSARVLHQLAAPRRYFPDFLTPTAGRESLEAGIDAVLHTPASRLAAEVAKTATGAPLPPWTRELADGVPARLRWLGRALATYHREAIAPFHERIAPHFEAHRADAVSVLATQGPAAMLERVHRAARWESHVLSTPYPVDLTLRLDGRGIMVVPSFFCRGAPITFANAGLDPVLVYPTDPPAGWERPNGQLSGQDRHLAALVGAPRARLLRALGAPAGTGEIAARVGLSASSASEHATVLRNAGLIRSTRRSRRVVHELTELGRSLCQRDPFPNTDRPVGNGNSGGP